MTLQARVLLVDDESDILDAVARLLQRGMHNVEVDAFIDPRAALDALRERRYDCIITDVRMPHMDGLEFLKAAEALRHGARTIVMTAFPHVDLVQTALNRHRIAGFISKPFDAKELVRVVGNALWERLREDATSEYVAASQHLLRTR